LHKTTPTHKKWRNNKVNNQKHCSMIFDSMQTKMSFANNPGVAQPEMDATWGSTPCPVVIRE
jgi:hypothetical protein